MLESFYCVQCNRILTLRRLPIPRRNMAIIRIQQLYTINRLRTFHYLFIKMFKGCLLQDRTFFFVRFTIKIEYCTCKEFYLMAATQRKLKEAVNAGDFAIIQLYSGEEGCDYHTGNHFFQDYYKSRWLWQMLIKALNVFIRRSFSTLHNSIITSSGKSIDIHLRHDMPTSATGMVRSTNDTAGNCRQWYL